MTNTQHPINKIWHPSDVQVERLRLLLSTFQDGTGMLVIKGRNLPGWRDFERSVALAFGGVAQENKAVFDVLVPNPDNAATRIGLSCKMRGELDRVARDDRVTIEVANSAGEFWDFLNEKGINPTNWTTAPRGVGEGLMGVVEQWHYAPSTHKGGIVEIERSSYFVLQWNRKGFYQLFQFPLTLPDPQSINWSFPSDRHILGTIETGMIFQWFGVSGGQLKYYPLAQNAIWASRPFELEPLPSTTEYGILAKAATYFPDKWSQVNHLDS